MSETRDERSGGVAARPSRPPTPVSASVRRGGRCRSRHAIRSL